MPVRSLSSFVLTWPDAGTVARALRSWADRVAAKRRDVLQVGYFGSYARGDCGVGSDVDIILILDHTDEPFERRGREWDTTELPVPAELLVYTKDEWERLGRDARRFYSTVMREAVWVYDRGRLASTP